MIYHFVNRFGSRYFGDVKKELAIRTDISEERKNKILRDMMNWFVLYTYEPDDYILFEFARKSKTERLEYYSQTELGAWLDSSLSKESYDFLADKIRISEKILPFMKRKVQFIRSSKDLAACIEFIKQIPMFLKKPALEYGGYGIEKYIVRSGEEEQTAKKMLAYAPCLLEEVITQSEHTAFFNHSSVNTLRLGTFRGENDLEVAFAGLRAGKPGALVDNTSSGGFMIHVNTETHKLTSVYKNNGKIFTDGLNPYNGQSFEGKELPEWEQMIQLVNNAYRVLPKDIHFLGWDLAHSADKGWMIVEVNDSPGSCQEFVGPRKEWLRSRFEPYIQK